MTALKFRLLPGFYTIVRLPAEAGVPEWVGGNEFTSMTRTADELSIVCAADRVPAEAKLSDRWICLKLEGPFPFSQTGVLLSFIEPLSSNRVPIFAISTFDTDYVLIQDEHSGRAFNLVQAAGHQLIGGEGESGG
ncbi:MAG: ACT domain-containing protein [Candidatus Sulfotelmatobacter sp.]